MPPLCPIGSPAKANASLGRRASSPAMRFGRLPGRRAGEPSGVSRLANASERCGGKASGVSVATSDTGRTGGSGTSGTTASSAGRRGGSGAGTASVSTGAAAASRVATCAPSGCARPSCPATGAVGSTGAWGLHGGLRLGGVGDRGSRRRFGLRGRLLHGRGRWRRRAGDGGCVDLPRPRGRRRHRCCRPPNSQAKKPPESWAGGRSVWPRCASSRRACS